VGQSQELPSGILPPNRREVENSRGSRVDNSIDDYLQNRPSQVNTFSNSNSKNHSRSVTPDNKSRTITPDRFNNLRQKDSNPNKVLLNKQPRKSNQESLELTFNHSTHSSEQEHQHELRDSHSFLTNATNTYDANNSNSKVNSHSRSLEIVNVMKEEEPVNIRKKYNFKLNLKKAINPVENANNLNIVSKSVNNNIKPSHKPLTELIGNSYNNKNKNNSDNQENDENMPENLNRSNSGKLTNKKLVIKSVKPSMKSSVSPLRSMNLNSNSNSSKISNISTVSKQSFKDITNQSTNVPSHSQNSHDSQNN